MQRAGTAERHQREVARIDAARHRIGADGERHVGIDDLDDAERRVLDREPKRLGHLGLDRLVGEVGVKRQVAAQHLVDVEPSEHDLRVGDRRLGTAAAVTGGAGLGACRARTDMEAPGGIDIGDGAAAGADRNKIDHRHQDWMTADVRVACVHDLDAAVRNGTDVGRSAADIDGDQIVAAAKHAFGAAADDAARRTRHQNADGFLRAGLYRGDATVRLDHAQVGAKAVLGEPALQVVEIERGLRPHEGVHRRSREALVFADHVGDFRRRADIGVGHFAAHDFGGAPFVHVVEE